MKILSSEQIRQTDQFTIKHTPIASIDLMERAANAFTDWFCKTYSNKYSIHVFCGLGNNGGDGLAIARLLNKKKYKVKVSVVRYSNTCSNDFKKNENRLKKTTVKIENIFEKTPLPEINQNAIVIDGLWGSGLNRSIAGFAKNIIEHINQHAKTIVAIDIPSGLFSDQHTPASAAVIKANHTVSFELPKLAFLFSENNTYVGDWVIVPIGLNQKFISDQKTNKILLTEEMISSLVQPRKKFSHKGSYGHALIITGSYGKMGAAVLMGRACIKSGVGLLTAYIPQRGNLIMQVSLPEAMVLTDENKKVITSIPDIKNYDAIGIGPGIGQEKNTQQAVIKLLNKQKKPLVIDADGLNILSANKKLFKKIPANSILTPHIKEFERLAGPSKNDFDRHEKQFDFSKKYKVYMVLKGAYTCITTPTGIAYFNSTGNPGMATGGSGDVLTGIITGLMAQNYSPESSCIIGVYLHGLAGDYAAINKTEEGMMASDIIDNLPVAWKQVSMNTQ